jgi:hypothetical protein
MNPEVRLGVRNSGPKCLSYVSSGMTQRMTGIAAGTFGFSDAD